MDPLRTIQTISEQIVDGAEVTPQLRAELESAVTALRQQRAMTLANSEAKVLKVNRPVTNKNPDTYAPVYLVVGSFKIMIEKNPSGDDFADRLVAAWNCCRGVPTEQLLPGHYSRLKMRDPS